MLEGHAGSLWSARFAGDDQLEAGSQLFERGHEDAGQHERQDRAADVAQSDNQDPGQRDRENEDRGHGPHAKRLGLKFAPRLKVLADDPAQGLKDAVLFGATYRFRSISHAGAAELVELLRDTAPCDVPDVAVAASERT